MTEETGNTDGIEILVRLWALKSALARRMERPGAMPGDDEMNRHILSSVGNAFQIAEDYFVLFEPLHAGRQIMTADQGSSARASLRDYGWAATALEDLMGDISLADKQAGKELSPLFARTVNRDYTELKAITDLINASWLEAELRIVQCEKAGRTLHLIGPTAQNG